MIESMKLVPKLIQDKVKAYVIVFVAVQKMFSNVNRQNIRQQFPVVRLQVFHIFFFLWEIKATFYLLPQFILPVTAKITGCLQFPNEI